MVTTKSSLKMYRASKHLVGSITPAALLLGWIVSTLLTVDSRYLTAQTNSQAQSRSQTTEPSLPDGPGKEIVLRTCVKCHNLKIVTTKRASEDEWAASVNNMVNRGAQLSDDEVDQVIDYLSKNFKPVNPDEKHPPNTASEK